MNPNDDGIKSIEEVEEFRPQPMPTPAQPTAPTPEPTPAPEAAPVTPTPISSAPEVPQAAPASEIPSAAPATEVSATPQSMSAAPAEVTVINNAKSSKSGGLFLLILIGLLIAFVFNIDSIVNIYDEYMNPKPVNINNDNTEPTNNLLDGYIVIGEESSVETDGVKFYSFKKSQGVVNFTYMASKRIDDVLSLGLYIELYNANKEILAKEAFNVPSGLDKDVVKVYSMNIKSDIQGSVYYARLRKYTATELSSVQSLTCTSTTTNSDGSTISNSIVYSFTNNELVSYTVSKQYSSVEETEEGNSESSPLQNELSTLPLSFGASLINNKLTYNVNLSNEIDDYSPLYEKGSIITNVKNNEQLKEWNCN